MTPASIHVINGTPTLPAFFEPLPFSFSFLDRESEEFEACNRAANCSAGTIVVGFTEPGIALGVALAWLLLTDRGGAR